MAQKNVLEQFDSLPPEAQQQVLDFIAFLKTRYQQFGAKKAKPKSRLGDDPFIGIWRDRADLQDTRAWIRKTRSAEWE